MIFVLGQLLFSKFHGFDILQAALQAQASALNLSQFRQQHQQEYYPISTSGNFQTFPDLQSTTSSLAQLERLASQTPILSKNSSQIPTNSIKKEITTNNNQQHNQRRSSAFATPSTSRASPYPTSSGLNKPTGSGSGITPNNLNNNKMFPNRGSHGPSKFKEFIDRASDEYNQLQNQIQQLRHELEKLRGENENLMRAQASQTETFYTMNMELQRNVEIVKRLTTAMNQFIPMLPNDQQGNAIAVTERARNVTPQDLMMQQQQQIGMFPGFLNGLAGPGAMHPMMAAAMAQMKPEDMAALMGGKPPPGMMMPPHPNMAMLAAAAAQMPPMQVNPPMGINDVADRLRRPRSGSGTPSKKPKTEVIDDQEFEIDVQNDDPPLSANASNGNAKKDGRESAQSQTSSRDSATPRARMPQIPGFTPEMMNMMNPILAMNGRMDAKMFPMAQNNGNPAAYSYHMKDGVPTQQPVVFPADAFTDPDVPKSLDKLFDLNQGEVVCAVTFAPTNDRVYTVYTGGKGCVKVWDINSRETASRPIQSFNCLRDTYIRSCKLFPEDNWVLVGGEAENIVIYDVNAEAVVSEFNIEAPACYALAIAQDSKLCFSCCANGNIIIWDIRQKEKVATLTGHAEGASCIDIAPGGGILWTGGLDSTVRSWDIGERREIDRHTLDSQAFSLGCCPTEPWVAVGTETNQVDMINTQSKEKYVIHSHESCVLSLKFAKSGKYFVTTGKDYLVNVSRTPYGSRLVRLHENGSVLSCDISSDEKYLVRDQERRKRQFIQFF
uniref:Groucho/TLE N-terminal Q-rich domain-containing protein n=1 Tax=Panagrolaimus sp. JU765 TaxID=591449 RepID=A0AC34PZT8_9BILA